MILLSRFKLFIAGFLCVSLWHHNLAGLNPMKFSSTFQVFIDSKTALTHCLLFIGNIKDLLINKSWREHHKFKYINLNIQVNVYIELP